MRRFKVTVDVVDDQGVKRLDIIRVDAVDIVEAAVLGTVEARRTTARWGDGATFQVVEVVLQ